MATFYLLPPRACLVEALDDVLGRFLPGLPLPADSWDIAVERLRSTVPWPDDVYLVTRDELPEDEPVAEALTCFGAEPGDRVVEVGLSRGSAPGTWVLGHAAVSNRASTR